MKSFYDRCSKLCQFLLGTVQLFQLVVHASRKQTQKAKCQFLLDTVQRFVQQMDYDNDVVYVSIPLRYGTTSNKYQEV